MGENFDRPPEERRRRGPLGDADAEETRQFPQGGGDPEATRPIPAQPSRGGGEVPSGTSGMDRTRVNVNGPDEDDERETRVIRASGYGGGRQGATPYPAGYYEASEEREARLRDMYGGVDWLASFLGFVFTLVVGAVLASIAGLVLGILGFSIDLNSLTAPVITGLAIIAVLIFLAYFLGGYVAGRLARFDGGRNGAMLLLWSVIVALLVVVAGGILSSFLPSGVSQSINDFIQDDVLSAIGSLATLGAVGIGVAAGALLVALLGGILGGRLGSRYHTEIDRAA